MSAGAVLTAIKARWDDQNLSATITGGYRARRGKGLTAPYVVGTLIGAPVVGYASRSGGKRTRYQQPQVQLLLVDGSGPAAAAVKAATIKAAFDEAPLVLAEGALLYCKFVSEMLIDDLEDPGNPNAVLWALTFDVLTSEATAR